MPKWYAGIFATWQKCDRRIFVGRTFAVGLFVGSFAKNATLIKYIYILIYYEFLRNFTIHKAKLNFHEIYFVKYFTHLMIPKLSNFNILYQTSRYYIPWSTFQQDYLTSHNFYFIFNITNIIKLSDILNREVYFVYIFPEILRTLLIFSSILLHIRNNQHYQTSFYFILIFT